MHSITKSNCTWQPKTCQRFCPAPLQTSERSAQSTSSGGENFSETRSRFWKRVNLTKCGSSATSIAELRIHVFCALRKKLLFKSYLAGDQQTLLLLRRRKMGARKSEGLRGLCSQKWPAVESWDASLETYSSGAKSNVESAHRPTRAFSGIRFRKQVQRLQYALWPNLWNPGVTWLKVFEKHFECIPECPRMKQNEKHVPWSLIIFFRATQALHPRASLDLKSGSRSFFFFCVSSAS